jgi:excisionase family DNA binding protein
MTARRFPRPVPRPTVADLASYASDEPLRPQQIARALNVSDSTVYLELRSGRLVSYRVGSGVGTYRVQRSDFRNYLHSRGIPAGLAALAH